MEVSRNCNLKVSMIGYETEVIIICFQVVGEGRLAPTQRCDLLEAPSLRHEYTSVSCPIIEHTECIQTPPAPTPNTPLLVQDTSTCDTKQCDIKLVINGCSYHERDGAGIPLLADA